MGGGGWLGLEMDDRLQFLVAGGLLALMLAGLAYVGDLRRMRRRHADAVGFMPWVTLFFWSLLFACILLGIAARSWLTG